MPCLPPCIDLCPFEPSLIEPSVCGCYPVESCQFCTIFPNASTCQPLIFPDTQNTSHPTIVTFPSNSPGLTFEVPVGHHNNTVAMNFSWGSIREVTPSNVTIKGIDVARTNWTRHILVEPALLTATLFATIYPHDAFDWPFNITLTIFFVRDPEAVNISEFPTSSLKLSLEIEGEWGFVAPDNQLHVDFSYLGPFEPNTCGDTIKKKTISSDQIQFDIYASNKSTFRINFLRYCYADDVKHSIQVRNPSIHGQLASFLLVYPSFSTSLFYDPSFALLLGFGASGNGCNSSLLSWILPASFLLGALVISLLICFIGTRPFALPFVKGEEGYRIHKLRHATAIHMKHEASLAI